MSNSQSNGIRDSKSAGFPVSDSYFAGLLDALSLMQVPGTVLSAEGKQLAANALFTDLWKRGCAQQSRLTLCDPRSDAYLSDALAKVSSPEQSEWPLAIAVPAKGARGAVVIYVWAVRSPVTGTVSALLSVHLFGRKRGPAEKLLRELFGLTPAEAKVARSLADGESISAIAEKASLSRETVRAQLGSVFAKTGTARQSDLAIRLCNLVTA